MIILFLVLLDIQQHLTEATTYSFSLRSSFYSVKVIHTKH